MIDVPFVDAHVHFWALSEGAGGIRYPWLAPPFADDGPNGSVEAIARAYLPADHRAALAGIDLVAAVHVEAGAHPGDALAETEWVAREAAAADLPAALIVQAALDDPGLTDALDRQQRHGGVRGVRHIANWHPDPRRSYTPRDLTRKPEWLAGLATLAARGLSLDLQCYPAQMPALAEALARLPELAVVVNHLGMPVLTDPDGLSDWQRGIAALAALPQVSVKMSGFGFVRYDWQVEDVAPLVAEAIDRFGPDRLMAATDFPTDTLFASPARCLNALSRAVAGLSTIERRAVFGGTANRVYRLGLDLA